MHRLLFIIVWITRSRQPPGVVLSYIYVSLIHIEFLYAHWRVDMQDQCMAVDSTIISVSLFVIANDVSSLDN